MKGIIHVIESDCFNEEMTFSCSCSPGEIFEAVGRGDNYNYNPKRGPKCPVCGTEKTDFKND